MRSEVYGSLTDTLPDALAIVGLVALVVGVFLTLGLGVALIVGGVLAVALGVFLDQPKTKTTGGSS